MAAISFFATRGATQRFSVAPCWLCCRARATAMNCLWRSLMLATAALQWPAAREQHGDCRMHTFSNILPCRSALLQRWTRQPGMLWSIAKAVSHLPSSRTCSALLRRARRTTLKMGGPSAASRFTQHDFSRCIDGSPVLVSAHQASSLPNHGQNLKPALLR